MRFALLFFFLFIIGIITYVGLTFNESQINTQPHVHEQQTQQPQPTQHELPINKTNKQVVTFFIFIVSNIFFFFSTNAAIHAYLI